MKERNISFKVFYEGNEKVFDVYQNEYRSLMHLLYDRLYMEGFGQCGGMGRCGTCAVITDVAIGEGYIRNEATTLQKRFAGEIKSRRLACQLSLDQSLHNCTFEVYSEEG